MALPGDDLVLQRQQEVIGRELVGSAASRGGAVEGEDHQLDHVT